MRITPCDFAPVKVPAGLKNIAKLDFSNLSYCLTEFPSPVRMFGKKYQWFFAGPSCQLQMGSYREELVKIPNNWEEFFAGYLFLPFGEPQVINVCGCEVYFWDTPEAVIMDLHTKSKAGGRWYDYQIQWLKGQDLCQVHYRSVYVSGRTLIGMIAKPGDYIRYNGFEPGQWVKGVALEFDSSAAAIPAPDPDPPKPREDPGPGYEWVLISTPLGRKWVRKLKNFPNPMPPEPNPPAPPAPAPPDPDPAPSPVPGPVGEWVTVYEGVGFRLQELHRTAFSRALAAADAESPAVGPAD
jgi:hypothetical protein